ncbi:unnamed protein product, partial [Prorocentrum cordatum]
GPFGKVNMPAQGAKQSTRAMPAQAGTRTRTSAPRPSQSRSHAPTASRRRGGGRGRHGERGAGRAARRGGKKMRLPIGWQGCSEDHAPVALYTNYCGTAAPVAHGGHGHRQVFGSPVPHDAGSLGQGMLPGQYCPAEQNVGLHAGPGGYCDGTCTTEAFSGVSKPWTRDGTCSAEAQSCSSSVSAATAAPAAAWVAQAKASSARARRAGAILGMVEARAGREWLARVGPW